MNNHSICFLTLLICTLASGTPTSSSMFVSRCYMECECSPTDKEILSKELRSLRLGLRIATRIFEKALESGVSLTIALERRRGAAMESFYQCSERSGYEACINADAALRNYGNAYCMYDELSDSNVAERRPGQFESLSPCSGHETVLNTPDDDPESSAYPRTPNRSFTTPVPLSTTLPVVLTDSMMEESPVPTAIPPGMVFGADGKLSWLSRSKDLGLFEGCVAVENMPSMVLQHRVNLRRKVLCWAGFCATPNHAIIVDGQYTSMKRLCLKRNCSKAVKMVNNLKISANRRAVYGDRVVITPYDYRFPPWTTWVVQIVEDLWHQILFLFHIGVRCLLAVGTFIFVSKLKKQARPKSIVKAVNALSFYSSRQPPTTSTERENSFGLEKYPEAPLIEEMEPKAPDGVEKLNVTEKEHIKFSSEERQVHDDMFEPSSIEMNEAIELVQTMTVFPVGRKSTGKH